jgi:hypothetical protein
MCSHGHCTNTISGCKIGLVTRTLLVEKKKGPMMYKLGISAVIVAMLSAPIMTLMSCSPQEYRVSTSCAPSTGGTINPAGGFYKDGNKLTLVASPAKNYRFDYWAGDVSGSINPLTITISSNTTVVASFSKVMYNLQTQINAPGSGSVDTTSGNFEADTSKTITATPASGHRFDHWGGNASGNKNPINVIMDADKTIIAYFTKVYSLNVAIVPADKGTVSPSNGFYDAGTVIKLNATTSFPYAFDRWNGTANDNVNPTTISLNSDKSVSVHFTQLTPGETVEKEGPVYSGNGVSIPIQLKQGEYAQGEIMGGVFYASIKDPSGTVIKDFGGLGQANFVIAAQVNGTYNIVLQNGNTMLNTAYRIKYTMYRK